MSFLLIICNQPESHTHMYGPHLIKAKHQYNTKVTQNMPRYQTSFGGAYHVNSCLNLYLFDLVKWQQL